jgi:hypothetical protein
MTARIDELVQQIEAVPDPAARALATDLVQAVMRLHAEALERILALAPESIAAIAGDDLVSRVLVLHGLHPDDFDTRLARAMDKLQRFFDSRGAGIELLEASPELLRVRFTGKRPGSGPAARQTIEDAIYEAVPEAGGVFVEVAGEGESGFVPLASLLATT